VNIFSRIRKRANDEGLESVISYFLRKINIHSQYPTFLDKKTNRLSDQIYKKNKGKVSDGIYKGLKLTDSNVHGSKLIGEYEKQIQIKIYALKKKYKLTNIVNFGTAEGYHILGAIKNLNFSKGLAFEIDSQIKKTLNININLNKLNKKIKVFNEANFDKVIDNIRLNSLNTTLFLIDIEGEEFNILNKKYIKMIKKSFLIIENHDFYIKNKKKVKNLFTNLQKYFYIEKINSSSKNPLYGINSIKSFSENEKWMIISEGRKEPMNWIICVPKGFK